MDLTAVRASATPYALALLRIVTGLLFFEHGSAKLLGFPTVPGIDQMPHAMMVFTGTMELVGGFLVTVGFVTGLVSFILSGYMAVAYFLAHIPHSFFPILNQGESAILYAFVFLLLAAAGPGAWALDNAWTPPVEGRRREMMSTAESRR